MPAPKPVKSTRARKPSASLKPGASYDAPPAGRPDRTTPPPPPRQSGDFIVEEAGLPRAAPPPSRATPEQRPAPRRDTGGGYIVQVAAFSSQSRAEALARRIGAEAVNRGGVWRVRYGPYPTQDAAQQGVRQAASRGFENGRIMANDGF
jgi:rare lipoprotein A